jgi:4-hydroxyphenylpyruvate dioxygenase
MVCRLAITSVSLGRHFAGHNLSRKLDVAQQYGYKGIELWHDDLIDLTEQSHGESTTSSQLKTARTIRQMCEERGIEILCLQPFWHYEGLKDRDEHNERIQKLMFWFQLAQELGTDIIQVPSSYLPADQISGDIDDIVTDLQKIADMGLQQNPVIRFVYESLCWGTYIDTWEKSWDVVKRVDRSNFGICLDTFNIAGRIFADPTSDTRTTSNCEEFVHASLASMVNSIDVRKIFYVQVVDAQRLDEPLLPGHEFYDPNQPSRMSWSRNCRLFYGEKERGAYLPIREVASAIFKGLGFDGWVSLELFNKRMSDRDKEVPEELARRGALSWAKLSNDMKFRADSPIAVGDANPDL